MVRDFETYAKWEEWNRQLQLKEFKRSQELALVEARAQDNPRLVAKAENMKFQFDREGLINYGNCQKFNMPVSFLPGLYQHDTQGCFEHRRGNNYLSGITEHKAEIIPGYTHTF